MSKEISFVDLENEFDDAMATICSLYELMQNVESYADFTPQTFARIGRGGLSSAKKAEKTFHDLMGLYLDEQQEIKRYMVKPKKTSKAPLVERAVSLIETTQVKHTKQ